MMTHRQKRSAGLRSPPRTLGLLLGTALVALSGCSSGPEGRPGEADFVVPAEHATWTQADAEARDPAAIVGTWRASDTDLIEFNADGTYRRGERRDLYPPPDPDTRAGYEAGAFRLGPATITFHVQHGADGFSGRHQDAANAVYRRTYRLEDGRLELGPFENLAQKEGAFRTNVLQPGQATYEREVAPTGR